MSVPRPARGAAPGTAAIAAIVSVVALALAVPAPRAAASSAAAPASPPAGIAGLDVARIDTAFSAYAAAGSPGCATGLVIGDHLAWGRGYGLASLEHAVPIDTGTVFDLGSTSKQFTAAVLALLARDGRLSLDDDIRKYLPEIPDYGAVITIRHLLTHTSGLRDYTDLMAFDGLHDEDLTTTPQALAVLARQRGVNFAPGAEYRYCNSGFFLASIIVERVAGKSLRAVAQERLFGPLGMTHTMFFDDHALVVPRRAFGYAPRPDGGFRTAGSDWEQVGDGGVQSSVEDMTRWAALFDTAGGASGSTSIPAGWLRGVLEKGGTLADGTRLGYGLGLALGSHRGLRLVSHGGAWAGYRAMLMRVPERHLAVITLCNVASANTTTLSLAVLDAALDALPDPPQRPSPPAAAGGAGGGAPASLAGTYYNEALGETLDIVTGEGGLHLAGEPSALRALGDSRFASADGETEIAFTAGGASLSQRETDGVDPRPVVYRRATGAGRPAAGGPKDLSGEYRNTDIGRGVRVVVRDGAPRLVLAGGETADLETLDRDLYNSDWGMVRVERDGAGRPTALLVTNRGVVRLRFRRVAGGNAPGAGAPELRAPGH